MTDAKEDPRLLRVKRGGGSRRRSSVSLAYVPSGGKGPSLPSTRIEILYGASAIQGRRKTMEDAHVALLDASPSDNGDGPSSSSNQILRTNSMSVVERSTGRKRRKEPKKGSQTMRDAAAAARAAVRGDGSGNGDGSGDGSDSASGQDEGESRPAFFGVFDGHGGDQCAIYASTHLHHNIMNSDQFAADDYEGAVREGFAKTDRDFLAIAKENEIDDGSTALVSLIVNDQLVIGNCGDSEAVMCRGDEAVVLSEVHNPKKNKEEADRIVEGGGRLYNRRLGHPSVNPAVCSIAVSRSLGDLLYKDKEWTNNVESGLIADPYVQTVTMSPDDSFLILACDGLWDVINAEESVAFVRERLGALTPQQVADELVGWAHANGSTDNITVQLLVFKHHAVDETDFDWTYDDMKLVVDDARGGDEGGGDRGDGGGQEIDVAGGGDGGGGPRSSVAHLDPESRLAAQEDRIADLRAAVEHLTRNIRLLEEQVRQKDGQVRNLGETVAHLTRLLVHAPDEWKVAVLDGYDPSAPDFTAVTLSDRAGGGGGGGSET